MLDLGLPDLSGAEMLDQMRTAQRDLPVVLHSGRSSEEVATILSAHEGVTFLQKPAAVATITGAIVSALRMDDS